MLTYFFVANPARQFWSNYWLMKDGQQGVARVTKEHWSGHDVVVYSYRVNERVYSGQDFRSWQNPQYAHVMIGGNTVIYFSASHPWLSAINLPRSVMVNGLPMLLLVWLLLAVLVVTIISPQSGWALRFRPGLRGVNNLVLFL